MNTNKSNEIITEEGFVLKFYDRPSTEFTINIPNDTLEALEKLSVKCEMSVPALIQLYFNQGLRIELYETFPEIRAEHFKKRMSEVRSQRNKRQEVEVDIAA